MNVNERIEHKKKTFLEIFKKNMANVSVACEKSNMGRTMFYSYMKDDIDFANKVEEIRESIIDFAESKLLQSINNGSDTAIIFFLKTIGKNRGYAETVNQNINMSSEPIQLIIDGKDIKLK